MRRCLCGACPSVGVWVCGSVGLCACVYACACTCVHARALACVPNVHQCMRVINECQRVRGALRAVPPSRPRRPRRPRAWSRSREQARPGAAARGARLRAGARGHASPCLVLCDDKELLLSLLRAARTGARRPAAAPLRDRPRCTPRRPCRRGALEQALPHPPASRTAAAHRSHCTSHLHLARHEPTAAAPWRRGRAEERHRGCEERPRCGCGSASAASTT